MTILVRAAAAVALLAFATPALPCGDKAQNTTASSSEKKVAPAKVATKSGPAAKKVDAKKTAAPKQASAAN